MEEAKRAIQYIEERQSADKVNDVTEDASVISEDKSVVSFLAR